MKNTRYNWLCVPTEGGPKRLKGKERARSDEGKEEPKPGAKTGLIKLKRCAPQSVYRLFCHSTEYSTRV